MQESPLLFAQVRPDNLPVPQTHLDQGRRVERNRDLYDVMVQQRLAGIEDTTAPNLGSIMEAMTGLESLGTGWFKADARTVAALAEEKEFNSKLQQYNTLMQRLNEEYLKPAADTSEEKKQRMKHELNQLNRELFDLASAVTQNMVQIQDAAVQQQASKVSKFIQSIQANKATNAQLEKSLVTYSGQQESSAFRLTSNWYIYLVWIIVGATIAGLTLRLVLDANADLPSTGFLIMLILVVYFFSRSL